MAIDGNTQDQFKKMMDNELKRISAKVGLDELKANLDTYVMASESLALLLKAYYDGFIKAGFDTLQAMYLTAQMASITMGMSMMAGGEKNG